MSDEVLRIASRGSQLALWQAESIRAELTHHSPTLDVRIEIVRTTGDRILDVPLAKIGDRGLFTKEIDEALLDGRADLAVHSLKDVPTRIPDGLRIAAVGRRANPLDVLIARPDVARSLRDLPQNARVGTSSLRRRAQLRHLRPDLQVIDLRGNLNTRLAKLDSGEFDAILLAAAGVVRLGWEDRITEILEADFWLPAVGQGALALVAREDDLKVSSLLAAIHDDPTARCVAAERSLLAALEGGCQVPIGALGVLRDDGLALEGLVADLDGDDIIRDRASGPADDPARVGEALAEKLLERGAGEILRRIREGESAPRVSAP